MIKQNISNCFQYLLRVLGEFRAICSCARSNDLLEGWSACLPSRFAINETQKPLPAALGDIRLFNFCFLILGLQSRQPSCKICPRCTGIRPLLCDIWTQGSLGQGMMV